MTEKEFFNGVLNAKNINDNAIIFLREIEDIENIIEQNPDLAASYIDLNENKNIDKESKKQLDCLKTSVKKISQKANIHELKVYNKRSPITTEY